jgi:hypothetical protein
VDRAYVIGITTDHFEPTAPAPVDVEGCISVHATLGLSRRFGRPET